MGFNRYYHTKKVEFEGIIFDSDPEVDRYCILREAQKRGLISSLELKKVFTLIPRQTEPVEVKMKTKTKVVEQFREHPVTYEADFVYFKDGKEVVEDVKGYATEDYILKRKMMRYFGHPIREVFDPTIDYPDIAAELNIEPPRPKKKKSRKAQKPKSGPVTPGLFE
jgi:hypothetical protein